MVISIVEFLDWLGWAVTAGGMLIECTALIATKFNSLTRCLRRQMVGFILFYVGIIILIVAKSL